jgi:hypothetical protein
VIDESIHRLSRFSEVEFLLMHLKKSRVTAEIAKDRRNAILSSSFEPVLNLRKSEKSADTPSLSVRADSLELRIFLPSARRTDSPEGF